MNNYEKKESFETVLPKLDIVSKHVAYYYFHKSNDENFSRNIIYHPHYFTPLNVYKNVHVKWDRNGRTYFPSESNKTDVVITVNNKNSKEVKLRGAFNKIGIVFKPLGINNFIDQPLSELISDQRISYFNYFGKSFLNMTDQVYREKDVTKKRELLDIFFKSRYTPFNDNRVLGAISKILNSEEIPKTQELAEELDVSRKTLLRLFKKHLCFTVEEFKSIVKFRKALSSYEQVVAKPKLTQVALMNKYYDQSDFINHFKSVTGYNPSSFFSTLKNISNCGTYWTFKE